MKKGRLFTVFFVVLIDLIGFGIVLPLLPFYGSEFGASAVVIGLLYSIFSFAQLIFSPIWGSLSDRIGRRPIMLMSTIGSMLAYIIFGLAGSLAVLLFSRLLAGVMGGSISTAQAYIADVTTEEDRAKGMGLIGAAFGIGFVLGPVLAAGLIHPSFSEFFRSAGFVTFGNWLELNKFALPGFFAAFLSFCSFLMVWFKLEETVDKEKAKSMDRRLKPGGVFTPAFWKKLSDQKKGGTAFFGLLVFSAFILSFGQSNLYSAFPLFSEAVLDMNVQQVSMQFFYIGIIAVIIQGGLIRPLTKWFSEEKIFLAGNILMALGMLLIGFATSITMLSLFLGLMAVGHSLNLPTMNSLISKEADPARMGTVMGTAQGLSGLGRTIGPSWGGFLFTFSAQIPFIFTSLIIGITIWIGIKLVYARSAAAVSAS
ncbi:MAG: MFS transporter [Balneolales bacterium]|nr:MFS transporter [Balneolales bacterium]